MDKVILKILRDKGLKSINGYDLLEHISDEVFKSLKKLKGLGILSMSKDASAIKWGYYNSQ